jgi:hypothetical protein
MNNTIGIRAEVLEDNGGGLHLFVWDDKDGDGNEVMIYEHSGYEQVKGQLSEDLEGLKNLAHPQSESPACWDGCEDNPQGDYDSLTACPYGHQIVAEFSTLKGLELNIDAMGASAEYELLEEEA